LHTDTLWNAVRDVNQAISIIGNDLLALQWLDCFSSEETPSGIIAGISGPFNPDYVQVGLYRNPTTSEDYFMLVNRRCLSTEQQDVTITLTPSAQKRLIEDLLASRIPWDDNPQRVA